MKYSLTKHIKKQELVELFLNLSDSFDENVPDVIWAGSEFEVNIDQDDVSCDIGFISTKQGGEFSIKVTWITPAAKKKKADEAAAKTKERLEKKTPTTTTKTKSAKSKSAPKPVEVVEDEDLWSEEEQWDPSEDDDDFEDDFDDEW
ncbi:MAG TPA: hypothetical protein VMX55_11925 [candidate division Zixibacteria bacterium]|nr:hypothetical protein [candidate division Zixibacteria bacterium]